MSEEKINHAPEDAAAAAEAELNAKLAKPSLMDIFVRGARKGWNIAIDNIIPNVLMAYVCIKILNVTGLLTLAGKFFAPVMAIWGLPGGSNHGTVQCAHVHGRRCWCLHGAL